MAELGASGGTSKPEPGGVGSLRDRIAESDGRGVMTRDLNDTFTDLRAEIDALRDERDRARDMAAALEGENARLTQGRGQAVATLRDVGRQGQEALADRDVLRDTVERALAYDSFEVPGLDGRPNKVVPVKRIRRALDGGA